MKKFDRYQANLKLVDDRVISYTTHVATVDGDTLYDRSVCFSTINTQSHSVRNSHLTLIVPVSRV